MSKTLVAYFSASGVTKFVEGKLLNHANKKSIEEWVKTW